MQVQDFALSVEAVRNDQLAQHGVHREYTVPRWSLIINGEVGKLNHAMEDLTRLLSGDPRAEGKDTLELMLKVRDQCVHASACMLAMLQEQPVFNPDR